MCIYIRCTNVATYFSSAVAIAVRIAIAIAVAIAIAYLGLLLLLASTPASAAILMLDKATAYYTKVATKTNSTKPRHTTQSSD